MAQELQGQQMFEYGDKKEPQIQTQILDPTMPSDLDFDKKQKQYEGGLVNQNEKQTKGKMKIAIQDQIKSYTVKGKVEFTNQPKFKCASYTNVHIDNTFEVKAFDQQKSGGFKSIWQSIIGYTKRQVCIEQGYIYIFQKTKQGYLTHAALKLTQLFKIFVDNQQSKIRLVFHFDKQHLKNKNFQVKSCHQFLQKIAEEVNKIGLVVVGQ